MTRHAARPDAAPLLPRGPLEDQWAAAPELAVLEALVAVMQTVHCALHALYPELADRDRPYWLHTQAAVPHAQRILRDAARLERAVERYRQAVTSPPPTAARSPPDDDDLPF